jgi:hypothetical protein
MKKNHSTINKTFGGKVVTKNFSRTIVGIYIHKLVNTSYLVTISNHLGE